MVVSVGDTANRAIDELERSGGPVTVARRCPELPGLLAACQSGLASVAVVACSTEQLTATLVDRLTAVGVGVVAVAGTPTEAARLRSIGAWPLTGTVTAALLADSVLAVINARRHPSPASFGFCTEPPPAPTAGHDAGRLTSAAASPGGGGCPQDGRSAPKARAGSGGLAGEGELAGAPAYRNGARPWEHPDPVAGTGEAADAAARPQSKQLDAPLPASSPSTDRGGLPGAAARVRAAMAGKAARLWHGRDSDVRDDGHEDGPHRALVGTGLVPKSGHGRAAHTREAAAQPPPGAGGPTPRTLAVWGPVGSPGRTTVAVNLAAEFAARGSRVMVVDADSYGASVAPSLGLLDESASFAQACRVADQGLLTAVELGRICTEVVFAGGTFSLLTGLTRSDRWPELRAAAVERVLQAALTMVDTVVIDCGFCLETDEELSYDTVAPRRNAATLAALGQADTIYAVGSADAIGLPRLIRALADLPEACAGADVQVVLNKVRKRAAGGTPLKSLEQAWQRFGPAQPISHALPWDADVTARALLEGRLLQELAPESSLRRAIRDICCAPVQGKQQTVGSNATATLGNPG